VIISTALAALSLLSFGGNSYYEDFEDGVANGWSPVNGDWSVIFGIYRGIGTSWPNNGVYNISHLPATASANYSVEALMSSDTGSDDVNKMLVLRFNDMNNFYTVNFRAGERHDVVVERMLSGVRTYITPEFTYQIPQHAQSDWKRCRADIIGKRVICYFEGQAVCDVALPTIVIPSGSAGLNAFSSGGGNEELYVDWFSWARAEFAPAISLEKVVGGNSSGGLMEVANEDNTYYTVAPRYDIARNQPNVQVVWTGQISLLPIREATVRFEGAVSSGSALQKLDLWDYQSSQWVQFDSRNVIGDTPIRIPITDMAKYIDGNGQVKVRASFFASATGSRFDVKIDEINVHAVAQ
jgi:hypothetical protein